VDTTQQMSRMLVGVCLVLTACASETDSNSQTSSSAEPAATTQVAAVGAPSAKPVQPAASNGSSASADSKAASAGSSSSTQAPAPAANASASNAAQASADLPKLDANTAFKDVPAQCRGFEVVGLKESPGGNTLPNKCAPFHGVYNNPYAIRCVDAEPSYKTPYGGDEYCILPPPAELGTQVHVGPEDYAKPGTFELAAGNEENTMYYVNAPNADDHYYYRVNWRMRAGSHHMIITVSDTDREDGWAADLTGGQGKNVGATGFDAGAGSRSFGGAQRPDLDRPQGTLAVPPENVGIGALLQAKQQFSFNLHHINTGESPVLREAWVNVWYMDKSEVTKEMKPLSASGSPRDVSIPARQRTVLKYRCNVQNESRIITMNGHRHAHTDRFSVWVKKQSGEEVRAYESFNWEDMPTYQYDSVSSNPAPDVANKMDGASTGELTLTKGDELYFLCDINNTLDVPLKFANEAIDGEMCILFGSYLGEASPCSAGATRLMDAQ
jgi:hypothetical protein